MQSKARRRKQQGPQCHGLQSASGLSEANQGLEDIAANISSNIELQAAQLVTSAAAGFGRRGGRQRCNLGERVLKLAHGLLALKAGLTAVLLVEIMAELAQSTNALLPVANKLGDATSVMDELFDFGAAEDVLISMLLGGVTGRSDPRTSAAGVVHMGKGLEKDERVWIFIVPSTIGFCSNLAKIDKQLRQALRGAVATSGRRDRRRRRTR